MAIQDSGVQKLSVQLNGATELIPIVGSPIAQVRSPAGMTESMQSSGRNAIVVPFHVLPEDCGDFFSLMRRMPNVSGIIVTVPHKIPAYEACDEVSERARLLGAVNTIRRTESGSLYGDMFDGAGYIAGLRENGCELQGKRALLVGAGGAGIAIAHALLLAGVAELSVFELDKQRLDSLLSRLSPWADRVHAAPVADPAGMDVVINATPCGMKESDPIPVMAENLTANMFVGDVITKPQVTRLLEVAQGLGCGTQTGADMYRGVQQLMTRFLLGEDIA
ncbi:Shikimate 5-dehydrogenase I alpha [Marinobacterium lacunae]|uniref:Shikimate 5-dehydrogenase I alpha n=1 Tax=Marinobacterium lacunae TaxID=1232683 RepID=A0A081G4T3_9GAMM|nr:hypothetical protein [Marinobacterium lacunae]KEA65788.1 Shikimate 5-dehydrogenase I alpha [Marinobacterium lacunae]MBR9883329.1 shikimate dehydrogenase [Oceanospirillales bacterium]